MRLLIIFLTFSFYSNAQEIPARWDELTASDWPKALEKSSRTCILPIGILEKHGPHAPMGSDLIHVREWAARAAKKEYAVVFPDYFYGQINEARHQPGTFALPNRLVLELLDSTCAEIGRNGFNKIYNDKRPRRKPRSDQVFSSISIREKKRLCHIFFPAYQGF